MHDLGPALDVGCGSGPTRERFGGWVGADRSWSELRGAHAHGRGPLVAADAGRLPVRSGSVAVAVAAMSLMVVDDPGATLAEVARVLRPGGPVAVLVPGRGPLTGRDRARYGLLLAVLGRTALPFPHLEVVRDPIGTLTAAGFEVTADDHGRFELPLADRRDADRFVDGLYLPGISARRVDGARAVVHRWVGRSIGIPLRRVLARLPA